jgi:hypothetical protein
LAGKGVCSEDIAIVLDAIPMVQIQSSFPIQPPFNLLNKLDFQPLYLWMAVTAADLDNPVV